MKNISNLYFEFVFDINESKSSSLLSEQKRDMKYKFKAKNLLVNGQMQ